MPTATEKSSSIYHPIKGEQPVKLCWWLRVLNWVARLSQRHNWLRFIRIARLRKKIAPMLSSAPSPKKSNYAIYEQTATFADIRNGLVDAPIVTDENNVTYVDQIYLSKLLKNIAKGESHLPNPTKPPKIIGLWDEIDNWSVRSSRLDNEQEYFSTKSHSVQSYIDDEWDESEKQLVYRYIKTHKQLVKNIIIGESYRGQSGSDRICTDGKYLWHESLEDYIQKYNVRPPLFFIEHIRRSVDESNKGQ